VDAPCITDASKEIVIETNTQKTKYRKIQENQGTHELLACADDVTLLGGNVGTIGGGWSVSSP
jgi:hypothetical protein